MKIRGELPSFTEKFDIEQYSRGAIVLLCISNIKISENINTMNKISTCDLQIGDNIYFTFNGVCKLYFKHHPSENSVTLMDYIFKNHSSISN